MEYMRGVDHALQLGVGLSHRRYQVPREEGPRPLLVGEKRYRLPADKRPEKLVCGQRARSCVKDAEGARRLEVIWGEGRQLLHLTLDTGSIGWPSMFFLYCLCCDQRLRGSFRPDPCHRRHNAYRMALRKAGLQHLVLEGSVVWGLRKGPWCGGAYFARLKACAENYHANADHNDPLFLACYDYIVADMTKGEPPCYTNSEENRKAVWDMLPRCPLWHRTGSREKVEMVRLVPFRAGALGALRLPTADLAAGRSGGRLVREHQGHPAVPQPP